jgi:hypothetical protein
VQENKKKISENDQKYIEEEALAEVEEERQDDVGAWLMQDKKTVVKENKNTEEVSAGVEEEPGDDVGAGPQGLPQL